MGIFTVPTVAVRKTRIYVSPSSTLPGEQVTLYKTEVNTHFEGGYLILPVPHPQTVRFRHPPIPVAPNQSPYLDFLQRVERAFEDRDTYRHPPRPYNPSELASFETTEVLQSIQELREFNEHEHILHESTVNQLADIYHQPYWGFILCSLHRGSFVYEPICYTHQMIGDELFIPSLIYQPRAFNDVRIPEETDQFHDRYFMNGCEYSDTMQHRVTEVDWSRISGIPWSTLPTNYRECLRYFLSESRRGMHWNVDALYQINQSLYRDYHPRERRYSDELYSYPSISGW